MKRSIAFRSVSWINWILLAGGLIVYLIGFAAHDTKFMNLNIGEAISHVGFLIAVVTFFHWIFENRLMQNIVAETIASATGSYSLARSGIVDYVNNSRDIKYEDQIENATVLVVCVHYSPRFLEDNFMRLRARTDPKKLLKIIALKQDCESLKYLENTRHEAAHIRPNMERIRGFIRELKKAGVNIEIVEHDSILRYSFVMSDSHVWVKFYKNAVGRADIPAIMIKRGSNPLAAFFEEDVKQLIEKGTGASG